jgi:hypothetical protein
MNLKRKIVSLVLGIIVIASIGAFAKGQDDNYTKKEAVTLTGTIVINNHMLPELTASGKTYLLLVPRMLVIKLDIKDGAQITVVGNIVEPKGDKERPQFGNIDGTKVLVEKATVNGKDYDLKDFADKSGKGPIDKNRGDGRRGNMMRGPGRFDVGDNIVKKDAVSLTGTVTVNNRMFPEITANGKTYLLMIPHRLIVKLDIKDGAQVTITGNIVEFKDKGGPRFNFIDGTKVLVEKATVNGKDYNVKDYAGKGPGSRMWGPGDDGNSDQNNK